MRKADQQDRLRILEYLQKDLQDCVYLYIDVMNYGVCSENMAVWLEEDERGISLLVMKYYDSFQVYSHLFGRDMAPAAELLKQRRVAMVSGRKDLIRQMESHCTDYRACYGAVYRLDRHRDVPGGAEILLAGETDAEEIAALICTNAEIGGHYSVQGLAAQLGERMRTGTGRSYIIREGGAIVAHTATYAEAEGIAVVSGTIIKPEYRNSPYYIQLSNHMLRQLLQEGKKAYTFAITEKMIRYHDRVHTRCGEYGKLVKRRQ